MIYNFFILLHLLFCFTDTGSPNPNASACPMIEGKFAPDIPLAVIGGGKRRGVTITGEKGARVNTIFDGVITYVDEKYHAVSIKNEDLLFIYMGVETTVQKGQEVNLGEYLGILEETSLFLRVKKGDRWINPRNFMDCD